MRHEAGFRFSECDDDPQPAGERIESTQEEMARRVQSLECRAEIAAEVAGRTGICPLTAGAIADEVLRVVLRHLKADLPAT